MYGSLSASSPHIVEPNYSAGPGIWSDLHLWGSNRSKYSHGRYAWIWEVCLDLTPPDFSIWSIPPLEVPLPPGLPASPLYWPPMGRVTSLRATIDRQAQAMRATAPEAPMPSAPKSRAPLPQAAHMVPPMCQPCPSSRSWPATPYQQAVQLPVKPKGRGVTFDSSTDKVVAVGSQDADGHGRQRTRDRDDKTRPASPGRGAHERSSSRTTGKQTLHQVSEYPSGAAQRFNTGEHLTPMQ